LKFEFFFFKCTFSRQGQGREGHKIFPLGDKVLYGPLELLYSPLELLYRPLELRSCPLEPGAGGKVVLKPHTRAAKTGM
jgi:hypothetical protein